MALPRWDRQGETTGLDPARRESQLFRRCQGRSRHLGNGAKTTLMTPTGRRTIERPVNLFKLKFAICVLSVTRCAKVQETYVVRLLVSLIVIDAI